MNLAARMASAAERFPLPDNLLRLGINRLVSRTGTQLLNAPATTTRFASDMEAHCIAEHTEAANSQHYELPPEFFALVLGPHRKYSCCLYPVGHESLEAAELHALEETVSHAELADGQEILELGCGWGSLSLFMAQRFPAARITAISNAKAQRRYIEDQARQLNLRNLLVITADINHFEPDRSFDRVVSVEMFEHLSNWRHLLTRVRAWLRPEGKLFVHVFAHATRPYRFDHEDEADWIAQHFFTGGIMPSHDLIAAFPGLFTLARDWRWSGTHYRRTAQHWLRNYDRNAAAIRKILDLTYGGDAELWRRRWRLFFLATAGLFGHGGGEPWGVSHYLLTPTP
jgi:cyclopropane-fatty-acyl-phospholipid synthase